MAELLVELLSEEIPARMQLPMAETLQQAVEERLNNKQLYHSHVRTYVTPRRLVLSVDGLSLTQESSVVEKRGPRVDAPQQAIDGFLRSTGLTKEQLTKKTTDKGEFYFAIQESKAQSTKHILQTALEDIIPNLTWPKSMRWGTHTVRWVRPLKNVLCVFGGEVMDFSFGSIEANNMSEGHRFLSKGKFPANDLKSYKSELEKRYVILDTERRKEIILEKAQEIAKKEKLTLLEDEGLLTEVAGLVEWPELLLGMIDKEYMDIPEEALISSIRAHQKYFCLRDKQGKLAPYFIVVSNMTTDDKGKQITAGNERVLRARLAYAKFFWDQDSKISLEQRSKNLDRIVFHAKLGTIADKISRVKALAKFLAVWVPHADLEKVDRAAMLCKADLTTEMVGEFPELQGLMGAYYAEHFSEDWEIVNAIREHYAPLGPNDNCPTSPVSVAIALADKIDTLVGLFAADEKPTGSKDPFALRRAALGVIRLILENQLSIPMRISLEKAVKLYPKSLFVEENEPDEVSEKKKLLKRKRRKIKPNEAVDELMEFFGNRLKYLLKAENIRYDLITSVFDDGKEDDLLRVVKRVATLEQFLATENGMNLLTAYDRATNIVRIEERNDGREYKSNPNKSLLHQHEEEVLFNLLNDTRPDIKAALKDSRFADAMDILASLRRPIDAFFEQVIVNCDDADTRRNRLKLLAQMRELMHEIADFSQIEH